VEASLEAEVSLEEEDHLAETGDHPQQHQHHNLPLEVGDPPNIFNRDRKKMQLFIN